MTQNKKAKIKYNASLSESLRRYMSFTITLWIGVVISIIAFVSVLSSNMESLKEKFIYESNFKIDGIKYRADFNADGSWIETETSIDEDDLPKAIREAIERDYEDSEISEIEKVDHHSKGIFYDVEFKQKGKNMDVEYKASGVVIN